MSKRWRQDQLGEVIAHELSDLIRTRLKDPRVGFASITDVEVSNDIRHAKVFVSVMGEQEEQRATLAALEHATGFLRHELAQRLTVRHTPELLFRLDTSIERGTRVLDLIHRVNAEPAGNTAPPPTHAPAGTEPERT
jgi:ribosome-binding factor A